MQLWTPVFTGVSNFNVDPRNKSYGLTRNKLYVDPRNKLYETPVQLSETPVQLSETPVKTGVQNDGKQAHEQAFRLFALRLPLAQ